MTRYLVCLSGGLDSVTVAKMLLDDGHEVSGVFFDRLQTNHDHELAAVRHFAAEFGIEVDEVKFRDWSESWRSLDGVSYQELPRNASFVLAALPFARARAVSEIVLGCNEDDRGVPDGNSEFVEAMNRLLEVTRQPERLVAPFLDLRFGKTDVAREALTRLGEEGVERTWSCYLGGDAPCGTCSTCRTRAAALEVARGDTPST